MLKKMIELSSIHKIILLYMCFSLQNSPTKNISNGVYLEACVLYFVKATIGNLGETGITLETAVLHNESFETTDFEQNLFWILPGKILFRYNMQGVSL